MQGDSSAKKKCKGSIQGEGGERHSLRVEYAPTLRAISEAAQVDALRTNVLVGT